MTEDTTCQTACEDYATDSNGAAACIAESCDVPPGTIAHGISREESQHIVLAISIVASLLASTISYLNPAQRWQQLRGAALSLESEIWKFRTRVGQYSIINHDSYTREPERKLLEFQTDLVDQVTKAAAILETTLNSNFTLLDNPSSREVKRFKHGQHKGAGVHGTFGASNNERGRQMEDDHHSPINANEYLDLRVRPVVKFYQKRLPRYYFSRTTIQYALLFGTFSSTILAFLEISSWSVIPSATATALSAWKEFSGTDKKLSRYAGTISKLNRLIIWWEQLSDVEKASSTNLQGLILSCEEVLERERESWLSTSMATKMLTEAAGGDEKGTSKEKKSNN